MPNESAHVKQSEHIVWSKKRFIEIKSSTSQKHLTTYSAAIHSLKFVACNKALKTQFNAGSVSGSSPMILLARRSRLAGCPTTKSPMHLRACNNQGNIQVLILEKSKNLIFHNFWIPDALPDNPCYRLYESKYLDLQMKNLSAYTLDNNTKWFEYLAYRATDGHGSHSPFHG